MGVNILHLQVMAFINDIYKYARNGQTVFSLADLSSINTLYSGKKLNSALKYLVKNKNLIRISRGLYAIDDNYLILEYANKFRTPSYISLYSILSQNGVVFQPYDSIYVVSNRSEVKNIGEKKIIYKKIADEILLNPVGIENIGFVTKASVERAICDKIYLTGLEYFDNLRGLDFKKIETINKEVYSNNKKISKWILQNTKQI